MIVVLLVSVGFSLLALAWSVILLWRVRDWRMLFLVIMLACLALRQGFTCVTLGNQQSIVSWREHWPELFGLAISIMALLAVSFLRQFLLERERNAEELRLSEERYRQLVEGVHLIAWEFDRSSKSFTFVSPQAEQALGYSLAEWRRPAFWFNHLHPDDRDWAVAYCRDHIERGESHELEYRMVGDDGRIVWFREITSVIRSDGRPPKLRGVLIDVTERHEAQEELQRRSERERLLMRELDHRVRNNLASLDALVDLSARSASDVRAFADAVRGRIHALARVHGMLSQRGGGPLPLRDLFESIVLPGTTTALSLEGPGVEVSAAQGPTLAMIVHELVSNSQKHGALGRAGGTVSVRWKLEGERGDGPAGRRVCEIDWRESGGPPIAAPPAPGLGTQLIRGLVQADLEGAVELDYPREGAHHRLRVILG